MANSEVMFVLGDATGLSVGQSMTCPNQALQHNACSRHVGCLRTRRADRKRG
jgi:hypothetical protein